MAHADVTGLVKSGGSGDYYGADIAIDTGSGYTGPQGGWTLVVVYESAGEKTRSINVWDGFDFLTFGATADFTINGLLTPSSGSFETDLAHMVMDGEDNTVGDYVVLNTDTITDVLNPKTNIMNGTISNDGVNVSTRSPNVPYNWSLDIDRLEITGIIPNSATSADFESGTVGDGLWGGVYVISTEIAYPTVTKTVSNDTVDVGASSRYTVTVQNPSVGISISNGVLTDYLPTGLKLAAIPNVVSSCGGTVVANGGEDSISVSGLSMSPGGSCSLSFDVTSDSAGTYVNIIGGNIPDLTNTQNITLANSDSASVTFVFNSTVAIDDDNTTLINKPVGGGVTTNDFDPEGDDQTFGSFLASDSSSTISSGATVSGRDATGSPVANAGTLTFDANGEYTYTPLTDFVGIIEVPYSICDDGTPSNCDTAVLRINVEPIPEPNDPTKNTVLAKDDDAVSYGEVVTSNALSNDGDAEGDAILVTGNYQVDTDGDGVPDADRTLGAAATTVAGVDADGNAVANAGTFTLAADGTYTFTPADGFVGDVVVDYTTCDDVSSPNQACETAQIHIEVYNDNGSAVNNPPFAGDDYSVTSLNDSVNGDWLSNDYETNTEDIRINGVATDIDPTSPSGATTVLTTLTTEQGG
ncbi:MAG: Ig-like domain-containing protein, partial [Bacteroidia bacterium]